jgi:endonuclease/exonuclease/phosphatase family metal-dependent hydrolase
MGDLNDGPGLDEYEKLFGRSGVEIVLGLEGAHVRLFDPHASLALAQPLGLNPTTARFYSGPDKRYFEALIDFIMVSPDLLVADRPQAAPKWRIWHPFDDPKIAANPDLSDALVSASDHFPVTIDLTL